MQLSYFMWVANFYEQAKNEEDIKKKENIDNIRLHFEKLITPIKTELKGNKYFFECPFSEKIIGDINNFIITKKTTN